MNIDYHRLGRVYPRLKLREPYPRRPRRKPVYLFPAPVAPPVLPPIPVLVHQPKRAPDPVLRKVKRAQVYLFPAPVAAPEFPVHLFQRPDTKRDPIEPRHKVHRLEIALIAPSPPLPDALIARRQVKRRPEVRRKKPGRFLTALIPAPAAPTFPDALFRRLRKEIAALPQRFKAPHRLPSVLIPSPVIAPSFPDALFRRTRKKITPLPERLKAPHRLSVVLIPPPVVAPAFPEALFRRLPKRIPPLPVRLKAPHRLQVTLIPPPPPPPPFNVITVLKRKKRRRKDAPRRRRARDQTGFLPQANWTFELDDWPFVYTKSEWGKRTWKMEAYMRVVDTPSVTQTTKMRLYDTTLGLKVTGSVLQSSSVTRERLVSLALDLVDGSTYRVQRSDQLGVGFGKARLIAS